MTNLVHQHVENDCVLATLAMYCNRGYEEAKQAYTNRIKRPVESKGVYIGTEMVQLAEDLGKKIRPGSGRPKGKAILLIRLSESDFSHPTACGDSSWYHAVYFDGTNIFDPGMNNSIATCLTTAQYLEKTVWWYKSKWTFWRKKYG